MSSTNWSKSEISILKDKYEEFGPKKCSEIIERSKRACQEKAKKLKLLYIAKYDKERFEKIITESKSKIESIKKLGLSPKSAGNYDTLNKYIKLYNLDISHFERTTIGLNNYVQSVKLDIKTILVENSTYSRSSLKKRLYEEGYKERICELCGQGEEWNGMKISMILDHINGVNNDNRIENLRIVCPNCNAGLPTHCRGKIYQPTKNTNNLHDLCECGNTKWKVSKTCESCKGIKQRKVERPSYETLLKDLEESNYVQVGKKYGVSDNSVRKWIRRYQNIILKE